MPNVQTLVMDSNQLANKSAKAMYALLQKHPALTSLSVCDNDFFEEAGQHLLQLVRNNPRITSLKTWGNELTPYLVKCVRHRLRHRVRRASRCGTEGHSSLPLRGRSPTPGHTNHRQDPRRWRGWGMVGTAV